MARVYGEKLMLREYKKEDFENIRKWVNDPEVVKYLSDIFLYPQSTNQTESFMNYVMDGKSQDDKQFIIALKDTEEYVGQIGLHKIDWKNRVAEMGIVIGRSEYQDKGIGTEAIKLLQYFVFDRLNLNRLELRVHDFNQRAIKCYLKCGFIEEGRQRKKLFYDGKYIDSVLMSILKEEYDKINI